MTKFEFLGDLSRLIADLPQEEIEQAMEYYEDYFADAGPEKEQEIIRDFISPAYIAEQLREASLQRQKAAAQASVQEEEKQAAAAVSGSTGQSPRRAGTPLTVISPRRTERSVSLRLALPHRLRKMLLWLLQPDL